MRLRATLLALIGALALAIALAGALAAPAIPAPRNHRVALPSGLSVAVPAGWHLTRRPLTRVLSPVQRLVLSSFALRRRPPVDGCDPLAAIGRLPPTGGYLFVWEYTGATALHGRQLARFPLRPRRFSIGYGPYGGDSSGPLTTTILFRQHGRAFQAQLYVGRRAAPRVRAQLAATLNSLQVG